MSEERTTTEVLQFVIKQMRHALLRPKMYGGTPDGLESYLNTLNLVREYIEHPQSEGHRQGISQYLISRGYGSASISGRWRLDARTGSDDELFREIVDVWQAFLDDRARVDLPSESESV